MTALLLTALLSCQKASLPTVHLPGEEGRARSEEQDAPKSAPAEEDWSTFLADGSVSMPTELRMDWPPSAWTTARVYTYNFAPPRQADELNWRDIDLEKVRQSIELTPQQTEAALELVHRTGGGLITTKCPFFPRHSVVFYDASDVEVGSMHICFSCGDTVSQPKYFPAAEDDPRMGFSFGDQESEGWSQPAIYDVHDQTLSQWERFFDRVDADRYEGPGSAH
jgi:hypothetical protein